MHILIIFYIKSYNVVVSNMFMLHYLLHSTPASWRSYFAFQILSLDCSWDLNPPFEKWPKVCNLWMEDYYTISRNKLFDCKVAYSFLEQMRNLTYFDFVSGVLLRFQIWTSPKIFRNFREQRTFFVLLHQQTATYVHEKDIHESFLRWSAWPQNAKNLSRWISKRFWQRRKFSHF